MKICVYAISKNEEKFVDRFLDSVQDADEIYVLDTGSLGSIGSLGSGLDVGISSDIGSLCGKGLLDTIEVVSTIGFGSGLIGLGTPSYNDD